MELNTIYNGDCLEVLKTLPNESINCVVTSPPYWGLRDYGTAKWEGGDENCKHLCAKEKSRYDYSLKNSPIQDGERKGTDAPKWKNVCPSCGAKKIDRQLGLEKTPEEYVAKMVALFREVRRVLKDDGTLWLNLGDSYATTGNVGVGGSDKQNSNKGSVCYERDIDPGLRSKNLVGIPWRVAFALQSDGWYLRQDIIWHKPNPMPESVTDRCTKAHEYIFLLTKSARYYYDNEAVKEPVSDVSLKRAEYGWDCDRPSTKNASMGGDGIHTEKMGTRFVNPAGRNKRSVWTVTTKPFKSAHFATFPPDLIEPCVLAGTSHFGACAECKTPYQRLIEKGDVPNRKTRDNLLGVYPGRKTTTRLNTVDMAVIPTTTTGWGKMCNCTTDAVEPCVILDPFSGAGTTGVVAIKHSRCYIGIELNPDYLEMSRKRIQLVRDSITIPLF